MCSHMTKHFNLKGIDSQQDKYKPQGCNALLESAACLQPV